MIIGLVYISGPKGWYTILRKHHHQSGVLTVPSKSCSIALSRQHPLAGVIWNRTLGSHGISPFVVNQVPWSIAMLYGIPCQQISYSMSPQIVVLAEDMQAGKANKYSEYTSILVKMKCQGQSGPI